MNEIWKNNYLGVNFVFFKSPFWPEVDNVDSWIFISYLVLRSFSHTSNCEKIELNLWSRHRFLFFNQNCGCDVINYANKPKHNHAQLDSLWILFRKFHWNRAVSLWELLIKDRHTYKIHQQAHTDTNTAQYFPDLNYRNIISQWKRLNS